MPSPIHQYMYKNKTLLQLKVPLFCQGDRVIVKAITLADVVKASRERAGQGEIHFQDDGDDAASAVCYEILVLGKEAKELRPELEPGMHCDILSATLDHIDPREKSAYVTANVKHITFAWDPNVYAEMLDKKIAADKAEKERLLSEKGFN